MGSPFLPEYTCFCGGSCMVLRPLTASETCYFTFQKNILFEQIFYHNKNKFYFETKKIFFFWKFTVLPLIFSFFFFGLYTLPAVVVIFFFFQKLVTFIVPSPMRSRNKLLHKKNESATTVRTSPTSSSPSLQTTQTNDDKKETENVLVVGQKNQVLLRQI
jgi:hypothetical protein